MEQRHILIADDEKNIRLCLGIMLRSSGFKVSLAKNGTEALSMLLRFNDSAEPVDLLITDIRMPELDGIQLIRCISQFEFNLPVIVITGFGDKKMLIELIGLGIQDFLEKPFGNNDVSRKIDKAFERQRRFKENFRKSHTSSLNKKKEMENDLQISADRKEFVLRYQPIIDLETKDIIGIEALIRWVHPQKGIILPTDFIPLAEETGLIVPIGAWVLKTACQQIAEYIRELSAEKPFILGINVSTRQLLQEDFFINIKKIIKESDINPECVKLEITESAIMDNVDIVLPVFKKLRKQGIRLAIDDFGTGYSSLSYLHLFPFDTLKIDRSFVDKIGLDDDKSMKIIQAVISLASDLDMNVVAEGIENEFQIKRLRELKCKYGQGFYFSEPLPSERIEYLLRQNCRPLGLKENPVPKNSKTGDSCCKMTSVSEHLNL
ncbi:EAL domain-containing response regulator [Desulfonema magnum]|uniref:Two component system response regulator, EAL domain-containing n=1 Tax=Desulfonema magnum TaxID=45655 RepID=A0A975BU76_9BACT|nr:EAL domain-containing response regulator [Desulfonema magnum]QTA91718.1 Two component system response regulator, EAL domain-containing [Desulfonema magnum]